MPDPPATGPPPRRADNLEYLRKQAKGLLRRARRGDWAALGRFAGVVGGPVVARSLKLSDAQLVIAREAGFSSWPKLRDELDFRAEVRRRHRLGSATGLETEMRNTMNMNESLKLGEIDQIGLSCTDLEAADRFYGDVLGLRPCGDVPAVMKFFDCDGVRLVIFKADAVPPNSIIYFSAGREAGGIERKVALLKAKGVTVESDAHVVARNWNGCDVWLAFFRDPFGNLLGLKSDVPVGKVEKR